MSGYDINHVIQDTQYSGNEIHIRDKNYEVTTNICEKKREMRLDLSDLELANTLCSSPEKDFKKTLNKLA